MEGEGDGPSALLSELITADLIKTQNQYALLPAAQKNHKEFELKQFEEQNHQKQKTSK